MKKLTNISSDAIQSFTLIVGEETAEIKFRFYVTTKKWYFDLRFRDEVVKGVKISLGVLHINNYNFPFDFAAIDTSGKGIDPFQIDDFDLDRIEFFMLTAEEMAAFRGFDVEV